MKLTETQKNFRKQMEHYKQREQINNDNYSECFNDPTSKNNRDKNSCTSTVIIIILVIGLTFILKLTLDPRPLANSAPVKTNINQGINETTQEHSMKTITDEQTADNISNEMADYYSQFNWYNSEFGIVNDSATSSYGVVSIKGRAIPFGRSYSYVEITYGIYSMNGSKTGTV